MIVKKSALDRRTFLRGVLGGAAVSVALPPLEAFFNTSGTAYASCGSPIPKRFGLFFWGNGVLPERWRPSGEGVGDAWELSEQLSALAPVKEHVSVVSGMAVKTATQNNIPHESGATGILTGTMWDGTDDAGSPLGPSIDQIIANELGACSRFKSIEFGAEPGKGYSWSGKNSRNPPESSPAALFERIFGGSFTMPGDDAEPNPRLRLRRSILDVVSDDVRRLQKRLGQTDKARLDQHLEGIRELEQRIRFIEENPFVPEFCAIPDEPLSDYPAIDGRPQMAEKHRAMSDIMALALACGQTRVFSNFFSSPVNNILFLEDESRGHHSLTHDEPGDQPIVNRIVKEIVTEYGYLVDALSKIPEGEGTLLDNCVVLGTTDCSFGRTHSLTDYPLLLAGKAGGALKTNVHYVDPGGDNASKVMMTILQAIMDLPPATFGIEGGEVSSGLSAIES